MNYLDVQKAVLREFESAWTMTPVRTRNEQGDEPAEFVRISIILGDTEQLTIGPTPETRNFGVVIVQIFTELGIGTFRSAELVYNVRQIFHLKDISEARFGAIRVVTIGETSTHYQENVVCPFHFDN